MDILSHPMVWALLWSAAMFLVGRVTGYDKARADMWDMLFGESQRPRAHPVDPDFVWQKAMDLCHIPKKHWNGPKGFK